RSGLTQLNHLAGQLAAHHVPLNLNHLYCRRDPKSVAWEPGVTSLAIGPSVPQAAGRGAVVAHYLGVMERFLDDQREIMDAYFHRSRGEDRDRGEAHPFPVSALPLLRCAEIVRLEAGTEVVIRRPLDLTEDLFSLHHTVGGQVVSKVDPSQHGLPVMPMT